MRILWSVVGGAALGMLAGMLVAPQSGRATRATIRDKSTRYSHDVQEFVDKKSRHLKNKAQGYRHKMQKLMNRGKEFVHEAEEMAHVVEGRVHHADEMVDHASAAMHRFSDASRREMGA
jgi:gas vesicle protein